MSKQRNPRIGDKYPTWFSGEHDNLSTIVHIKPYTGRFKQFFDLILTLTAKNTLKGTLEIPVSKKDLNRKTIRISHNRKPS